jgi:hypothetical protein
MTEAPQPIPQPGQPLPPPPKPLPPPNPVTQAAHRGQVLRQVILPLILGIAVFAAFAVLAALLASPGASRWADITIIFLSLLVGTASLLFLALLGLVAYGLLMANRELPPRARLVQDFASLVESRVRRVSDQIAEPVLRAHSASASARAAGPSVRRNLGLDGNKNKGRQRPPAGPGAAEER